MFETPIVMIDFETSGMSPDQGGRVTEVAALRLVGDQVVDRYVSLINCGVHIPYFITELTGISQKMVNNAPPVSEVIPTLLEFIGSDTLAAHNASFDEKFLFSESNRLGLRPSHNGLICSVKLARRILPGLGSYSLGPLASSIGIRFNGTAHRAEADAEVASSVMLHIADQLRQTYGVPFVEPSLLEKVNKLTAAKVPRFLQQYFSSEHTDAQMKPVNPVFGSQPSGQVQRYRHYKGGIYELVCEATQESDLSPVIVYRSHNGSIWTRPKAVFFEQIMINGKSVQRFTPMDD
ncbi:DUF1653 domain-containing protein [Undibacterium sp. SXout7W]|uniref:DUF1653 domain-containing protein n=1 Tax=Undibacterium sp. SXout7W TaxID=3413049 RepID=UPI003BF20BDD